MPSTRSRHRRAIALCCFGMLAALQVVGWMPRVALAQSASRSDVKAAREGLEAARAAERQGNDKSSAVAYDEALTSYNSVVELRLTAILERLKEIEAAVKQSSPGTAIDSPNLNTGRNPLLTEYRDLTNEYAQLASSRAPQAPTVVTETEPNNTSATANLIGLASEPCGIVSAAINPGNDVDFYTFTAPAGSRAWIETDTGGTQNAGATSRDTVIDLLAADGTTVIENDDDDGTGNGGDGTVETGLASMIGGRTLTTGGTYFIRVRAFSATAIINPYRLFVLVTNVAATAEVEANDTAATANPLVAGAGQVGLRSGAIGAAGDADYYAVTAAVGSIVYVNVDADPERDGTGTDLVVEVRNPADGLLLQIDSSITGSLANPAAEGANFAIATAGTYFVRVRHFSATGTGTYHIMASSCDLACVQTPTITNEAEPNNTSATSTALNVTAQPVAIAAAAINPGNDVDFYTFTAPAGSRAWIETDTGGTQNAGATSRDTVIDLLAADGTTVIENDDDDGTGNGGDGTVETGLASMIGGRTLTTGGTYFIRVRAFSATAIVNPYRLFVAVSTTAATAEVEPNNTAATANVIAAAAGATGLRSGAIGAAGDADYYSATVAAGNILYVNVDADPERDGTGTDLVVEVRNPADGLLLQIDSSITGSLANPAAEGASFTISTAGTYFVRVRHFSATGTGTYHILTAAASGPCGPVSTPCTITCPANVTQSNAPNQCGAVVNYPAPTTTGDCGTVTCTPASGSFFPVGTTTVTCTPTSGSPCSFMVTINDTQPPVITCPANVTQGNDTNQCGAVVNYPAPTVSDNCPGATVVCTPPSGSSFPLGTTAVSCTATDAAGNTATCGFNVTINDTQAPAITCPANISAVADMTQGMTLGTVVNYTTPTPTDNCPGSITTTCAPASGSFFPVGTTTVTCTATDPAGNAGTCSFMVTVGSAFTNCYVDDATGDTLSIVSDPTSPLYGFWQYRVAAGGAIFQGTAEYLSNYPGRALQAYDHDNTVYVMDLTVQFGPRTATATVTERAGNVRHVLRDRNIANDPPCQ